MPKLLELQEAAAQPLSALGSVCGWGRVATRCAAGARVPRTSMHAWTPVAVVVRGR